MKLVFFVFHLVPYKEHLSRLKLFSNQKCQRSDLISACHIVNGLDNVDLVQFSEVLQSKNRQGHDVRFKNKLVHLVPRVSALTQKVVNAWNRLPVEVAYAPSLDFFKRFIDREWTFLGREVDLTRSEPITNKRNCVIKSKHMNWLIRPLLYSTWPSKKRDPKRTATNPKCSIVVYQRVRIFLVLLWSQCRSRQ